MNIFRSNSGYKTNTTTLHQKLRKQQQSFSATSSPYPTAWDIGRSVMRQQRANQRTSWILIYEHFPLTTNDDDDNAPRRGSRRQRKTRTPTTSLTSTPKMLLKYYRPPGHGVGNLHRVVDKFPSRLPCLRCSLSLLNINHQHGTTAEERRKSIVGHYTGLT